MKKNYSEPQVEIIEIETEDVIVCSCTGYDTPIIGG